MNPSSRTQRLPDRLWLLRHGQSAGNVASDLAEQAGLPMIDLVERDMDVPLSALGEAQSVAIGRWFAQRSEEDRPAFVLCSPYRRARHTAELIVREIEKTSPRVDVAVDERLREKEYGVLDRFTRLGIQQKFPELHEQRAHVGKFYFRPPGGESWCDVVLRLRSVQGTLARDYRRRRVLVVAHEVIVTCFRYLFEGLDEAQILEIDRQGDVPNCGVTDYAYDGAQGPAGRLVLRGVNFVAPMEQQGAPVTTAPDVQVAPKA